MYTKLTSCILHGIEGKLIGVEVDIANGIPNFEIVGLANTAVKEAKGRVRSAIKNSGLDFPTKRITINLAPSNLPKGGSQLDLSIALSILTACGQGIDYHSYNCFSRDAVYIGELSLDGKVRRIDGALPMAMSVLESGYSNLVLPAENAKEVSVLGDKLKVFPINSIEEAIAVINCKGASSKNITIDMDCHQFSSTKKTWLSNFNDVKGQEQAKRALEIAVAGMHNILMIGPPGTGKSMLAKRIPSIMPGLNFEESLEVTKIYSASGKLDYNTFNGLIAIPPVRTPHHSITEAALIGGGKVPIPGEISLAHRGILVLDELSEFSATTLDLLRQPLEDDRVVISRAHGTCEFPSKFMLVATTNPCPCGYFTVPGKECTCTPRQLKTHHGKITGALWDRIDIQVEVPLIEYNEIISNNNGEDSQDIQQRVISARLKQQERYGYSMITNSRLKVNEIKIHCSIDKQGQNLLNQM